MISYKKIDVNYDDINVSVCFIMAIKLICIQIEVIVSTLKDFTFNYILKVKLAFKVKCMT